ncbi:MAG: hypothetical protein A3E78_13240 [Alphaproteobacteria bacterium RIFCSPHIGHO2_12_FULL_63_12]|nr:MAG: hypothetical protein A3E78_13240 [Alphaproteobacteria bacterium RIFCSPHIGHO2_12_FULL_63_12]
MKKTIRKTLLGALAFAAVSPAAAQQAPLANTEQGAVGFTQVLAPGSTFDLGVAPASVASRSYHERVSAADLERGVDIVTQANGAVVRLTPVKGSAAANAAPGKLLVADLEISRGGANPVAVERSGALVADQDELKRSNPELFEDTLAFRLADTLGQGRFRLKAARKIAGGEDYMIQVFDKGSDIDLVLDAPRQHYFANGLLAVKASLPQRGLQRGAEISAALLGPGGQRIDLRAAVNGSAIDINGGLPASLRAAPGELWRVAVSYRDKAGAAPLYRDAELALAVGERTASIKGSTAAKGGVNVAVDVAAAGRYEARAYVYAKNAASAWEPAALLYAADWLEPGARTLALSADVAALEQAGYQPPFKLRQLQLLDQSRLMVLDTRTSDALPQFER